MECHGVDAGFHFRLHGKIQFIETVEPEFRAPLERQFFSGTFSGKNDVVIKTFRYIEVIPRDRLPVDGQRRLGGNDFGSARVHPGGKGRTVEPVFPIQNPERVVPCILYFDPRRWNRVIIRNIEPVRFLRRHAERDSLLQNLLPVRDFRSDRGCAFIKFFSQRQRTRCYTLRRDIFCGN